MEFGPAIGHQSSMNVSNNVTVESLSETVISAEMALGLEFPIYGSIGIATEVAYLFTGDFNEPIGGRRNINGALFSVRLGWTFGKHKSTKES